MFKKITLTFSIILFSIMSFSSIAASQEPIKENVQYKVLNHPASKESSVTEFFSFYCGVCAYYNQIKVVPYLNEHLEDNVKVSPYHVSLIGNLSNNLTEAWAIAEVLGIQDQVETPIFDAVKSGKIRSEKDIVNLFEKYGVTQEKYHSMQLNFLVKMLVSKQHTAEKNFNLTSVPTIIVNDHYAIIPSGLDGSSNDAFKEDIARVINYLLNKDKQAQPN